MTRREEIQKLIDEEMGIDNYGSSDYQVGVCDGVRLADKTMIEKACKCYCDDICDKSRRGMCFHKYDGEGQVKNHFRYNECNELKLIRKSMEE